MINTQTDSLVYRIAQQVARRHVMHRAADGMDELVDMYNDGNDDVSTWERDEDTIMNYTYAHTVQHFLDCDVEDLLEYAFAFGVLKMTEM